MASYLLGVDNGSSVIRAGLYTSKGYEVAVERADTESTSPEIGYYQCDLEQVFQKTAKVIQNVIASSEIDVEQIKAVSFTGHVGGICIVDSDGKPVCDGIYSIDKRAKSIVERWSENDIYDKTANITQQRLWSGQLAAIMKWFGRNDPQILDNASWVMQVKDYIRFRMCGKIAAEETGFSGTGVFDINNRCLSDQVLETLGLLEYKRLFPPIIKSCDLCGVVTKEAQMLTGVAEGTSVVAGLSPMSAGGLAVGLLTPKVEEPSLVNVYVGTWANNQFATQNIGDGRGMFMTSCTPIEGKWIVSQMSATSSSNLSWFVDNFLKGEKEEAARQGVSIYDICDAAVVNTLPEDSDVVFLPYIYDSIEKNDMSGALLNVGVGADRDVIIRAIYEGIIFSHRENIEILIPEMLSDTVLRASGGREESNEWWQMLSNMIGRPVEIMEGVESRTFGVAICASVAVGMYDSIEEAAEKMVHVKKRYEPDQQRKKVYDRKYEIYKEFIHRLL